MDRNFLPDKTTGRDYSPLPIHLTAIGVDTLGLDVVGLCWQLKYIILSIRIQMYSNACNCVFFRTLKTLAYFSYINRYFCDVDTELLHPTTVVLKCALPCCWMSQLFATKVLSITLTFSSRIIGGVFQGLWLVVLYLWCLCRWLTTWCPCPLFGTAIKRVVCEFDTVENSFSLLHTFEYIMIVFIDIHYYLTISVYFVSPLE